MSPTCCGTTRIDSADKACVLESGHNATRSHSPRGRPLRLNSAWGSSRNCSNGAAQIKILRRIYDSPRDSVVDQDDHTRARVIVSADTLGSLEIGARQAWHVCRSRSGQDAPQRQAAALRATMHNSGRLDWATAKKALTKLESIGILQRIARADIDRDPQAKYAFVPLDMGGTS
jgi:hypothetical protein